MFAAFDIYEKRFKTKINTIEYQSAKRLPCALESCRNTDVTSRLNEASCVLRYIVVGTVSYGKLSIVYKVGISPPIETYLEYKHSVLA